MGMGSGRRFRHPSFWGFYGYPQAGPFGYAPAAGAVPPVDEEATLSEEAKFYESELGRIKARLGELKKSQEKTPKGEPK